MSTEPRSNPASTTACYQVDDLIIDTLARRVTRNGIELPLTSLSFDLLLALALAAPNLASFEALIERAWSGGVVSPEAVTQRVKQLRQALGDSADHPRYIFAVRGHGYRMPTAALPLAAAPQSVLSAIAATPPATDPKTAVLTRRWLLPLALTLVIGAGGLWWGTEHNPGAQPQPHAAVVTAAAPAGSIAVMPFSNLTGDPSKDYFSDGMTEEIINALGQIHGLKVPGRTSSFAYKGRNIDVRRIAQDLGVSTVLEGSVRSAGTRIRISAQLVNAHSGYQIWSQSYDRQSEDIFKLEDDLASAITKVLQLNPEGIGAVSIAQAPPTQNVEAYDLYLQGVARVGDDSQPHKPAAELFGRALALDPSFARAYAGLGLAKFKIAISEGPPIENLAEAVSAAQKALSLDPTLAAAHSVLANVAIAQGQWVDAEAQSRAALSVGRDDAIDHLSHAIMLIFVGHLRGALDELNTALVQAPGQLAVIRFRTIVYSMMGRDADALNSAHLGASLGDALKVEPVVAAVAALRSGRYADAAAAESLVPAPPDPDSARTVEITKLVYAALADPRKKAAALAARTRLYPKGGHLTAASPARTNITTCMESSYTFALLGEFDTVFDMANQCLDEAAPGAIDSESYFPLWTPEAKRLRQDPRFQALATRLRFMEYWQQYGPPDDCDLKDSKLNCR